MKILLIDTSGKTCGAALGEDGEVRCRLSLHNERGHSVRLMPMVEEALEWTEWKLSDIDVYACVTGPGSFTGVRIGAATVKALAMAQDRPCIAVDALEALAVNAAGFDGTVCPILDARAGQVYGAAFRNGTRVLEDTAESLEEYLARPELAEGRLLFTGDGSVSFRKKIEAALGERAAFAPHHLCGVDPAAALAAAFAHAGEEGALVDCMTLLPLYLRAPQAERERAAKEAAKLG